MDAVKRLRSVGQGVLEDEGFVVDGFSFTVSTGRRGLSALDSDDDAVELLVRFHVEPGEWLNLPFIVTPDLWRFTAVEITDSLSADLRTNIARAIRKRFGER